jgi:hypothetical protein
MRRLAKGQLRQSPAQPTLEEALGLGWSVGTGRSALACMFKGEEPMLDTLLRVETALDPETWCLIENPHLLALASEWRPDTRVERSADTVRPTRVAALSSRARWQSGLGLAFNLDAGVEPLRA